jgi:hypothetical protein
VPCAPLEFDERSIREVFRNHMTRHVPPAQASPEQIVLRAEVRVNVLSPGATATELAKEALVS